MTAWLLAVVYWLAAIVLGHLTHELAHILTARVLGARNIEYVWPHLWYDASSDVRLLVSLAPVMVAGVGTLAWVVVAGAWWLDMGAVALPHPFFGWAITTGVVGANDLRAVRKATGAMG